ncbi:MAG: hypothetical protein K0S79_2190 [Nitrospira sp.]|jgi:hypothetical protein|nr:hypothetical protein [Nitrospira sp.]
MSLWTNLRLANNWELHRPYVQMTVARSSGTHLYTVISSQPRTTFSMIPQPAASCRQPSS